eukprot:12852348-Alexandrium_andersonii.AAC.1
MCNPAVLGQFLTCIDACNRRCKRLQQFAAACSGLPRFSRGWGGYRSPHGSPETRLGRARETFRGG